MSSRQFSLAISRANNEEYVKCIEFLSFVCDLFRTSVMGKSWKPIQTAVILSTLSVLKLQENILNADESRFLLTSRLSQDCLENLISTIRIKSPVLSALQLKIISV